MLEITYFNKACFVHSKKSCRNENHHYVDSLPDYTERLDGRKPGCYIAKGEVDGFSIGRYSSYGQWRELLCWISFRVDPEVVWSNEEEYKGKPFFELICMADNEGSIGPLTSKKLANDFGAIEGSVREKLNEVIEAGSLKRFFGKEDTLWWLEQFDHWHKAFLVASDDGFVRFM